MDQKLERKLGETLLDARKEALKHINHGTIRAHGKLWGMDVFSWGNPEFELVKSMIESFPFPVIWVGNKDIFDWCGEHHPSIWSNIKTVIAVDFSRLIFTQKEFISVENVIGISSVDEAFEFVKGAKYKGAVLLFTASGDEWERNYKSFNDFMSLHQIK